MRLIERDLRSVGDRLDFGPAGLGVRSIRRSMGSVMFLRGSICRMRMGREGDFGS